MSNAYSIPTSGPADRPTFKILAHGNAISAEYQVQGLVVSRSFNRIADATVWLLDGSGAAQTFAVSSSPDFVPGTEIEIHAGYHGKEDLIFKGLVVRHGIKSTTGRPSVLEVDCRDCAIKLTLERKSCCFIDLKDSDILSQLASAVGLSTDVEGTNVSHCQMVQYASTDWDFLLTRAEANGKLVSTDDGKLVVKAPQVGSAAIVLQFGGNLLEFEAFIDARTQHTAIAGSAWSAADQTMSEVQAAAAGTVAPGNLTSASLASAMGSSKLSLVHPGELKQPELQAWADSESKRKGFAQIRGRARTQGFASVKLGDTVELAGVGDRFCGKTLVSGVRHQIDQKNWETDIAFGLSPETFGRVEREVSEVGAHGLLPAVAGLHIGKVVALTGDPDGNERVQVTVPAMDSKGVGIWARLATLDAGSNRGTVFRPEIGDEVVVGFVSQDPRHPVILGQLHSAAAAAPIAASDDNNEKGLLTRNGIAVTFNDDKKSLTIMTPNGNSMTLSDDAKGVVVADENGNQLTLNSDGVELKSSDGHSLVLNSDGVTLKSADGHQLVLGSDGVTLESAGDLALKASGDCKIEGVNVKSSAQAEYKAEGSGGVEVSSSAITTIKGSLVRIN